MKEKITDEIRSIFANSEKWIKLEIEYAKLTAAEKFTILSSAIAMGAVVLILALLMAILLSFALVGVFQMFMTEPLAYLSTAGVVLLFIILIYLFRKPLIADPIARFVTRLFIEHPQSK